MPVPKNESLTRTLASSVFFLRVHDTVAIVCSCAKADFLNPDHKSCDSDYMPRRDLVA